MVLTNSYLKLGEEFYEKSVPTASKSPKLFLWNSDLATELKLDKHFQENKTDLSEYFSGNQLFPETTPIALAYSGHQFGHFSPRLGDGRAHLLGELKDDNFHVDVQLKGSGRTPFSRGGDGRCALGPAIREFIMSEAMHALGIPTSRSLAVVTTGEPVFREDVQPGAIVTRIAASHVRVGTFEYFYSQENFSAIEKLCEYVAKRHYPELNISSDADFYIQLIQSVFTKQIELVCHWMRVGFIHGVMNTDNTAISGETIDYGPCAMMSTYNPNTVFSSIDAMGRYRFGYQPHIAQWNMVRFTECLLPFLDDNPTEAQKIAEQLLGSFSENFEQQYFLMLTKKMGLFNTLENDKALANELLELMRTKALDYTQTFYLLTKSFESIAVDAEMKTALGDWYKKWKARLSEQSEDSEAVQNLMKLQNPVVIPRNHHMEAVIEKSIETGSSDFANNFLKVLKSPYKETELTSEFQDAPADNDRNYQTFCGT